MRAKVRKLTCLIVALIVAVFTVGYAFAWFVDRKDAIFSISGASAGAYFDSTSGDGTSEEEAFVIANSTHMRNLAVLQNTGRFRGDKYYFKIKDSVDEIDMGSLWLPPIGNDDNPFIGEFNGNGKTISNLKVTTDKSLLTEANYPTQAAPAYKFSQAVGLFGNTGEGSNIRNFILDKPHVLVGAESTTAYGTATEKVVGIAVGHVAGMCQSIGVRATDAGAGTADGEGSTSLDVRVTGYSTFNSILGELGEGVESSVTGGGHTAGTGGSGAAFGSSFDVEDMVRRLNLINENKLSSTPSWRLPNVDNGSNYTIPDKGAKMPFSINAATSTYTGADAKEEISNNNVGYFLGNQNKIEQTKELSFSEPLIDPGVPSSDWYTVAKDGTHQSPADSDKVPAWIYKFDGGHSLSSEVYTSQMGFAPLSQEEFDELPQDIKDIFPDDLSQKKTFLKISLSTALWLNEGEVVSPSIRLVDDNGLWSYHGQISWMGKTYGEGFRGADGNAVDENGDKYSYLDDYGNTKYYTLAEFPNGIMLPNSTIWFKPSQAGKVKIIMFSPGKLRGFALIKIKRNSADRSDPFKTEIINENWNYTSDIELSQVMRVRLPRNVLFYYEYEITQETIDAGNVEYMMVGENGGADFIYLDLGASAAEDTSAVVPDKVSAVDFIYDGVEIEQEDETIGIGNFIVDTSGTKALYDSTKTSVYFEKITMVLKVVYVRLHNDETDGHSGKTICLEYSDPKLDTNSEVKATYATYVCPTIGGGSGTVSGGGGGGGTVTPTPDPTPDEPTVENLIGELTGTLTTGSTLCDNAYITATLGGGGATVTATSATSDDGKTFNSYLLPAGTNRNYSVAAKQKVTVIIYYTIRDSSGVKQGEVTAAVTRSDGTSEQLTSSDGTRVDSKAYKLEITLEAGDSFVLSSGNRLTLYGIYLSK